MLKYRPEVINFRMQLGYPESDVDKCSGQPVLHLIVLCSEEVKKQLEKSSIGATMNNLNQSILSELLLNIPPVFEQHIIVEKLDKLRAETQKLEAIYKQKIEDLEELKKSILT